MTTKKSSCRGCCCGGCWGPPTDPRAATAEIIPAQQYCCRCIPKYMCLTVQEVGFDDASTLLTRYCGADYEGDPIQYQAVLSTHSGDLTIRFRLSVVEEQCYLTYEIDETGDSGEVLIDHTDLTTPYDCVTGMKTDKCVHFGGEWTMLDGRTLTLAVPDMFEIQSTIRCAGCSCMCDCLCLSIASQAEESITIVGSNEVVCSVVSETEITNCAATKSIVVKEATWTYSDWVLSLGGDDIYAPSAHSVTTGSVSLSMCSLAQLLRFVDDEVHEVTASLGTADIEYQFDIGDNTPLQLRWVGGMAGAAPVLSIQIYNWNTSSFEILGAKQDTTSNYQMFTKNLTSDHVGTGGDEGEVRVRLVATDCDTLTSDMLVIQATSCCRIYLTPPIAVVPTTPLAPYDLSTEGNCPNVFNTWQFTDETDTQWYVAIDCAWCGGNCGTVSTECCEQPVPRTLFAEVTLGCSLCSATFVVPLFSNAAGSLWEGSGFGCGEPFDISLSCAGGTWQISAEGAGACSYSGSAATTDCDPFYLTFSGRFQGGIGCCGVGSTDTDVSISIVVFV